jgi:hypothetical protein
MIIELPDHDRPICPNIDSSLHRLHVKLIDAISEIAEKDEDGDFINSETVRIYSALAYGRFDSRLYLFREIVSPISLITQRLSIQSYYFRCYICGFTVAAQAGNW